MLTKPNYDELYKNGVDPVVLWFIDDVYDMVDDNDELCKEAATLRTISDMKEFQKKHHNIMEVQINESVCRLNEIKDLLGIPEEEAGKVITNLVFATLPFTDEKLQWNPMTEIGKDLYIESILYDGEEYKTVPHRTPLTRPCKYVTLNLISKELIGTTNELHTVDEFHRVMSERYQKMRQGYLETQKEK